MKRLVINISGGAQVGTLNLGQIIGNIENHLEALQSPDVDQLGTALQTISEAIIACYDIDGPSKRELLETIDFLAISANQPAEDRHPGAIRPTFHYLARGIEVSAALSSLWTAYGPIIGQFFDVK